MFSKNALLILFASILCASVTGSFAGESTTQEKVEILRDTYGIPHVFAETNDGAYYGAGWAYAENYAPLFLYEVLDATGRSSEVINKGVDEYGENIITNDIVAHALRFYELAENWTKLPESVMDALTAFSNGFNDYIADAEKAGTLKTRFENSNMDTYEIIKNFGPLTPRHLVAYAIMQNTQESLSNMNDSSLSYYINSLQQIRSPRGSNAAAISGYKMDTGNSVLYGDPHNPWVGFIPTMHIHSRSLDIHSLFSGPFASDGRFNNYAIASPRTKPDTADIYEETINPSDPLKYLFNNKWLDITVKTIVIKNKNGKKIEKKLYYTHRGWIFDYPENASPGKSVHSIRISVCDPTFDRMTPLKHVTQRFFQSWSKDINEYYYVSKTPYSSNHANVMADGLGNIAYIWNGRIPVRNNQLSGSKNIDYSYPLSGNNPMADWSPKVWRLGDPEFNLPFFLNPRGGVLHAANDAPWYATGCDDEPEQRFSWATPELVPLNQNSTPRGLRLKEILCEKTTFTFDSLVENLVFDTLSINSRDFISSINKGWNSNATELHNTAISEDAKKIDSILRNWNFRADIDQPGMTAMFHLKRVSPLPWFNGKYVPSLYEMNIYIGNLEIVASEMKRLYGKIDVPWGDIHYMSIQGKDIPLPGGTKNIPTLFQAYMISSFPPESEIGNDKDDMYGDSKMETNQNLLGKILCNFGSTNIHMHLLSPNNVETYYVASNGPIASAAFPKSNHILQYPLLFSEKKIVKVPLTKEAVMKELCPWGKDPAHEHKDITVLNYPPNRSK